MPKYFRVFPVVCIILFLWISSRAEDQCPVLKGGTIAAEKITEQLAEKRCVVIEDAKVEGTPNFPLKFSSFVARRTVFSSPLDVYLSEAAEFKCDDCKFESNANFHSVRFSSFWLTESAFNDDVVFVAMQVEGILNLAGVKFKKSADFSGATIGELNATRLRADKPVQISWAQFGPVWLANSLDWARYGEDDDDVRSRRQQIETSLRFWQRNFQLLGQQRDALEVNHEILQLKKWYFTSPFHLDWWAITLTSLPSRHGTLPYRPLWIGLLVILIFAVIYRVKDPFVPEKENPEIPKTPLFLYSLLYSIDTFIPVVEFTGVRKWGWKISPQYRWVAVAERCLGLLISGLAAYSISSVVL